MLRLSTAWIALLAMALLPVAAPAEPRSHDGFDAVVIDPGHGGDDEGAHSSGGAMEKEVVLDVALRLAKRLRAQGLRVVLTRESDAFVPLETRTSAANDARAHLFVSIHANWAPSEGPRGIETYFASGQGSTDDSARGLALRENSAFRSATAAPSSAADPLQALFSDMIAAEDNQDSDVFARLARKELLSLAGAARDVKQAPFIVLMGVQMAASLIEIGFLSNPADARALASDSHREAIARALERAVIAFGKRYDARRGLSAGRPN